MRRQSSILLAMAVTLAFAPLHAQQPALSPQTLLSGGPLAPEQQAVDFAKADLTFKVDPAHKRLEGDATLTFHTKTSLQRLVVDLDPRYAITLITVDGKRIEAAHWRNPDGRLSVDLPTALPAGARTQLRIVYAGSPHEAKRAPWDGGIVWATAPTGEPWIATAVEGEGCDLLWPCIDHPAMEPAVVEQRITVPTPLVAASNGRLLGTQERAGWRTWHWRAQQPDTYAVALNIGPYQTLEADYRSRYGNVLPLRMWYLQSRKEKAEGLFAELPLMLDFFEEVIGPYPWSAEKVGVVETPHLGMEHQTINAYGNDYKKDIFGYDWLMHHEFAHEWFGNQMTNRDWDDMWLHEGFAMYMQPLYLQWLRGDVAYYAELQSQRGKIAQKFPLVSGASRPHGDPASEARSPGSDIYYKGAWILHTLRGLIGDAAFRRAMTELVYGRPDPKPGNFQPIYRSTEDYIAIVNRVSGRDLRWFFDVYLRSAAMPKLLAERREGRLLVRWEVEGGKPFPLPVQVRVGERVIDLPMTDGRGDVPIANAESFTLDPHSRVLRDAPEVQAWQRDVAERRQREAAKP